MAFACRIYAEGAPSLRFSQGRVAMLPTRLLSFCTDPVAHAVVVPALCKLRKGRGTLCFACPRYHKLGHPPNGTARLMKNVSISSKAGAYNPYLVDIRGGNASVLIAATHMEENPNTGNDCVYVTAGANVTVKGDKFQCPNATVHRDATAGQGSVENVLNSAGALFEDDQITPGSGTGCGNNCWLKNPGTTTSGSYSSYSNFTKAAAPIFTAWGFVKQATPAIFNVYSRRSTSVTAALRARMPEQPV
jgi:hypothetical protein